MVGKHLYYSWRDADLKQGIWTGRTLAFEPNSVISLCLVHWRVHD